MEDLEDDVVSGSEEQTAPVSLRDSLRAAMDEQTDEAPKREYTRSEDGKFAAADKQPDAKAPDAKPDQPKAPVGQAVAATQQPADAQTPVPATPVAPAAKAPPGWSPEAKASFETLPPHVQAAVAKREQEVENGFRVLQDYKGLEQFTPMVRQAGTTHAEVMNRAVQWERSLQLDPVNTVINAMRLGGINPQQFAQAILQGRIQPQQQPQPQRQPVQQPNVQAEVERVLHQKETERQLSEFFANPAHSHANDESVSNTMAALISSGQAKSLQEAYEMAIWARPDIRAQLINQQTAPIVQQQQKRDAVNQARQASRSITGSSSPGASKNGGQEAPQDIRGSLRAAYRAAQSGGSV